MEIIRKEYSVPSKTGVADVFARCWAPEAPKAVFQIVHGMAEHGERYARFAKKLCEHGYAVFAQDAKIHISVVVRYVNALHALSSVLSGRALT